MTEAITIKDASELRRGDVVESGEPFAPIYETILSDPIVTADEVTCEIEAPDDNGSIYIGLGCYWRGIPMEIERDIPALINP